MIKIRYNIKTGKFEYCLLNEHDEEFISWTPCDEAPVTTSPFGRLIDPKSIFGEYLINIAGKQEQ